MRSVVEHMIRRDLLVSGCSPLSQAPTSYNPLRELIHLKSIWVSCSHWKAAPEPDQ